MKGAVLSYHLKVLKDAGLVARSVVATFRVYDLTPLGREMEAALERAVRSMRG